MSDFELDAAILLLVVALLAKKKTQKNAPEAMGESKVLAEARQPWPI